jgi:mono/diheme cytochrome c family protein
MRLFPKTAFGQAALVLVIAYVLIDFGIPYIPPLLGIASAPVPNTVLFQYMLTVTVGVLLWVSDGETRWREFKAPIQRTLVDPNRKILRGALLIALPLLVAFVAWNQVRPTLAAPPSFRAIHPAPPGQINFQGRAMTLTGLENPLRHQGNLDDHYREGLRVYYQNCLPCHGDLLDGNGHYAEALNPIPLSFQDVGTIQQLTESFVFWRIAKGGPGLPNEGGPWNSSMPAWEQFLTENEIWSVIIFLYEQANKTPRTWEEEEAGENRAGEGEGGE